MYEYNTYSSYLTALDANYDATTGTFNGDFGLQTEANAFLSFMDSGAAGSSDPATAFQQFIAAPSPSWWQGDFVITNGVLPGGQLGIPKLAVFGAGLVLAFVILK